ncbi:hypothetical protein OX283_014870, partial [Flavobacterium sp. SUN052]|uniref:beta strand repeat-containing protein n=1 Tax=Flavobacterium sp. SUN052 TaxID=3002441 RepID=UPI00237E92E8
MKRKITHSVLNIKNDIFLKFKFILLAVILFAFSQANSQVAGNYAFSTNATASLALDSNSNTIDMTAGTTSLVAASSDDTVSALTGFNLGSGASFNFNFCGVSYTNFGVTDNGIITLGVVPVNTVYALPNATTPTISAFANDTRVGTNGSVVAKIVGTAPNRTLVLQWTNVMIRYLATAASGTATYQVRLYETTNSIEFVYGTMTTNAATPANYFVGISSNTTATNLNTVNTSTNVNNTTATPSANTYTTSSTITALNSAANGSRRLYRFTPPVCTTPSAPTALNLTAVTGGGSITGTFTAPGTIPTGYLVIRTTTSTAPTTPVSGVTYTPGTTALGGYIVSTNTTTGLSDSGLSPSTPYWYWVYSYNNTACSGGPLYSSSLSGTRTTLTCTTATNNFIGTVVNGTVVSLNTPSSWSLGHFPTSCENVTITVSDATGNGGGTKTYYLDLTSGALTCNNLTITFTGSGNATNIKTLFIFNETYPITVLGNLIVSNTSAGAGDHPVFFVNGIGSVLVNGTSTISKTGETDQVSIGGGDLTGSGSWTFKGDVTFGPNGTINYQRPFVFDANGTQTLTNNTTFTAGATDYGSFKVGDTNTTSLTLAGTAVTINRIDGAVANGTGDGSLTVSGGSSLILPATFTLNQVTAAASSFNLQSNATLKLAGISGGQTGSNFPLNFGTVTLNSTSTVEYNGAAQTVYNIPIYGNVTISTSGIKTAAGNLTIAGNVLINAPATFAGSTFSHSVAGNWTNAGTYTPSTGTVSFSKATGTQTVDNGTSTFNNLSHTGLGILQLVANNLTVSNILTLNGGTVDARTNAKSVILSNTLSSALVFSAGFVDGNMQRAVNTAATSYLWPVGFSSNYTPATFSFTNLTAGNLTVISNSGDESNLATSSLDASKSVNSYWGLSGTLASTNYSGTFSYPSTLNDDTAVVGSYKLGKNNSGWTYPSINGTPTSTSLSFSTASGLGTMAIAKCKTPDTSSAGVTQTICSTTSSVTLSANNPVVGVGTWSVISGPSLLATQFANVNTSNTIFTPSGGAGTYVLQWSIDLATPSSCSNPQTSTVQIIVNPNLPASVSIAASATTICAGTSVTFTTTPTNGGTTPAYQWKVNGTNAGTNSATFTTTTLANNDLVTVVMTSNATPCLTGSPATSNTITMTVNPNLPASVSIAASATTICAGTSVTFTATPTNGGTTPAYQWKVNGTNAGTNSATFTTTTLANNDSVTVVMTSNATPCLTGSPATSNTITMTVNPNLPASVSIAASATTICAGTSVTFTATPTNGGTTPAYQWKVNGTNAGTNSATFTTTTLANTDAVTVVMTSNATPCLTGSPATSNTITMTVNPNLPASVSIAASATTICAVTSVTFTATPTNGGTTPAYQWKVNGTNAGTNSATFTTTTLANTDAVTVVMTSNATPCLTGSPATSNTITMTVNPNLPASVSIAASATTICAGTSVTFTATPTNGGTTPAYQWKVNGTNAGTNSATFTTTTLANNDLVTVVLTSNATPCLTGSPATSNTITMTVNPNLPASVSIAASATTICTGTSVTFTATPTNGGTTPAYQWKVNGTNAGTNSATFSTTTLANNDSVTVVLTSNATPCLTGSPATSNAISITVNPTLVASVSISASATTICAGTSVTFTATPTNGGTPTYQWQVNGTDVSGQTASTFTTTTLANNDSVTVVMTSNATPCLTGSPATSNAISITVNPTLVASVSISASATTICTGTSVTFTATPTNGGTPTYQW